MHENIPKNGESLDVHCAITQKETCYKFDIDVCRTVCVFCSIVAHKWMNRFRCCFFLKVCFLAVVLSCLVNIDLAVSDYQLFFKKM